MKNVSEIDKKVNGRYSEKVYKKVGEKVNGI
jgi:hypothetical protein